MSFSCWKDDYSGNPNKNKDYKITAKNIYRDAKPFFNSGNDSLRILAEKLITLGEAHRDTAVIIEGKLMKAGFELRISNYPQVVEVALEALEMAEKKNMLAEIPEVYSLIGNAYKENDSYKGALKAAQKALEASKKLKDTSKIIGAMLDYAMFTHSYSMLKKNDSIAGVSLGLYMDGLHLAQTAPQYEKLQIAFLDNISQYFKLTGDYEKGIKYGLKGAELAKKYHQKRSLTYSFNWLGEIYYKQGFHQKGMAYLDTALQYTRDLNWGFREAEILNAKYECYKASGNAQLALKNYVAGQNIRDSLKMLQNIRQVSLIQTQYQTGKKDQKISMLNQLSQRKAKETRGVLIGLGAFILLSVFLAFQYRLIKRQNRALKNSYEKINRQSQKLKLLMKELHHRVKNNLQIVSSLLSLQTNHLSDEESLQAVKTGQQRIEAMSLIHRSLYKNENPNSVNMPEYVISLIENIMQSFGRNEEDTDINICVDIKELDVELALPLGLIINEWVTNVFKYAFQNAECPGFYLSLNHSKKIQLEMQDNGPGMEEEVWENPKDSFGIKLIKVLCKQLDGKCEMYNQSGTRLRLHIPFTVATV